MIDVFRWFLGPFRRLADMQMKEPVSYCLLSVKPSIGFEENDFYFREKRYSFTCYLLQINAVTRDSASLTENTCARKFLYLGKIVQNPRALESTMAHGIMRALAFTTLLETCGFVYGPRPNGKLDCTFLSTVMSTTSNLQIVFPCVWWTNSTNWVELFQS